MTKGLALYSERSDTVIPLRALTAADVLYGDRVTSYWWEVLEHRSGSDYVVGKLDGVIEGSATLQWTANREVKGSGNLRVIDLGDTLQGFLGIAAVDTAAARLRPVMVIENMPGGPLEIPFGVYLFTATPEEWDDTGRTYAVELLDRATVLDQDKIDATYALDAGTPILAAVATVIASAGEAINVDASVTDALSAPMVWKVGTSKLQIVNDLLDALNYSGLWVDGDGQFRATPYVVPAKRPLAYELLNGVDRELLYGETSIYEAVWSRDRDLFDVPNKVVVEQSGNGDTAPLVGSYTNEVTDPSSPLYQFSYAKRGRWITKRLDPVEVPDYSSQPDPAAATVAFLNGIAQRSLIASSASQSTVKVRHVPVPLRVSVALRFQNAPAGIDARHTVTSLKLECWPTGLMEDDLQEVIDL